MNATADSSVLVAALAPWHDRHGAARAEVATTDVLITHALAETFAVLTGLPMPHRTPVASAAAALAELADERDLVEMTSPTYLDLISRADEYGLVGGAFYDALIAATARTQGATLVSLDTRAQPVYRAVGATVRFIG